VARVAEGMGLRLALSRSMTPKDMGNDRWHSVCKAYYCPVRNSRADLTQQNVQNLPMVPCQWYLRYIYERRRVNLLIFPYPAQISGRDSSVFCGNARFIERCFNWEHIAPPSVGLTACSSTRGVRGEWYESLRRPLPSVISGCGNKT
jgi:hypothetical protein